MSYYDLFRTYNKAGGETYLGQFLSREETISDLKSRFFDIVIVGGGIHGATFARLAALSGLKTALFERDDYASQTSSRSSKMAHGGLRYLELLDFQQVFEGIKAREDLFSTTGHLASPHEFLIPVKKNEWWKRFSMGAGLSIYDFFLKDKKRKHRWEDADALSVPGMKSEKLAGGYLYTDGIMNDTRIVLENIVAARQEGARCLNYASIDNFKQRDDGFVEVGWTDCLMGEKYQLTAGIVVNCAGPWAPLTGRITTSDVSRNVRYSQGIHLLFNRPWRHPALFLPLPGRGRYYFVWPHFAGTLVGTTEREVNRLERDPVPLRDEVEEVLGRLAKDLPGSGLERNSLHYGFAGVRTLVLRGDGSDVSKLSRKHLWNYSAGVLTLLGGKFTTAVWTCSEGLDEVYRLASVNLKRASIETRKLPGYSLIDERVAAFRAHEGVKVLPAEVVESTIARLGGRCIYLLEQERGLEPIGGRVLRGEVELAIISEQAEKVEDLMRRRLDLEYLPDHGLPIASEIASTLSAYKGGRDLSEEVEHYRARLSKLHETMGIARLTA